ncbi:MAG: DUF58 domain-containing protein [Psychroflexus sp.]|jgi:uncharacterized protein (DUF58 family)|nr:DUF58 domain-containing protein [Psychroflexus sp.]MDR9447587.1 DUF58 domain-containing protein [Psychroflexus sp.]
MDTKSLLKKVRKIEIKTKRLSNNVFGGEYHSAFKGRGMTFSEVRKYQYGDDVRAIDWNVTARSNEPHIKVFEEERELTLMLVVDVSGSGMFATHQAFKRDIITEIAATLAFSATQNNDKVGLILFSSKIELYIPPKKGRSHVLRIIRELIEFKPEQKTTDIGNAVKFLSDVLKKRSIAFILSDFMDDEYKKKIQIAAQKHDLTGIRIYDRRETELPDLGLIKVRDNETGKQIWVNSSSKKTRKAYANYFKARDDYFKKAFKRSGAGSFSTRVDENYVTKLLTYFKARV